MNQSTERELRELFAAEAADAPDEQAVAAAAIRRVHRRRRTLTTAVAPTVVIIAAGGYSAYRPATTPRAQPPGTSSAGPVASAPGADLPAGVEPGDPLAPAHSVGIDRELAQLDTDGYRLTGDGRYGKR